MKWLRSGSLAALTVTVAFLSTPAPIHAQEGTDTLVAALSGDAVVGGGDEDGQGTAALRLSADMLRLCYDLSVSDIADATAAHIHRGEAGRDGPPVITLSAPREGASSDCIDVAADVVRELLASPEGFYVNVHNPDFPGGAIRGQLAPA
jgi:hypothetical protein